MPRETQTIPVSPPAPRARRWWLRTRLHVLVAILIFIPCFVRLWRAADYSLVGYRVRSTLASKKALPFGGPIITYQYAQYLNDSSRQFHSPELYSIWVDKDGSMQSTELDGSWDDFSGLYFGKQGELWQVTRTKFLECQHILIPWHFKGRVEWKAGRVSSASHHDEAATTVRVLEFLSGELGRSSTRASEIARCRNGNDLTEWHDWLAFAMNAGLLASTSYFLFTLLRLPWLIRSRYRDYRFRKALQTNTCIKCRYDLSGTRVDSNSRACPECGMRNPIDVASTNSTAPSPSGT